MKTYYLTKRTRVPTTNDHRDGYGDYPNWDYLTFDSVEAESMAKARAEFKRRHGPFRTTGVGASHYITEEPFS